MVFSGEFLWYGIVFVILALVATAVGARGIAGISMAVARLFIAIFLILAVIAILL